MSSKALNAVIQWRWAVLLKCNLPPSARHVLLTISVHINTRSLSCWPSINTLSRETGLNRKTVMAAIKVAAAGGWIRVQQRGFTHRAWKLNEYVLGPQREHHSSVVRLVDHQREAVRLVDHQREAVRLVDHQREAVRLVDHQREAVLPVLQTTRSAERQGGGPIDGRGAVQPAAPEVGMKLKKEEDMSANLVRRRALPDGLDAKTGIGEHVEQHHDTKRRGGSHA